MNLVEEVATNRLNLTASNASLSNVALLGVFVSSSTAGTIKIADANGTVVNTFTGVAGTFHRIPVRCVGAVTITIGGTIDCTVFYN